MNSHHGELVQNPPSDESAAMAEVNLGRLLRREIDQGRTELHELAPHVEFYLTALHENKSGAIHLLVDRVETEIKQSRRTQKEARLPRITLDAMSSAIAATVTNLAYELTLTTNESEVDIGFIYPDPVRHTVN